MPQTLLILKEIRKIDDLETHIDNLVRQKEILQSIEEYSNQRFDFGDIIETYNLLTEEIERLQKELREKKGLRLSEEGRGGGEEQDSSLFNLPRWSLKYYNGRS
jgi:hypothetical protein